MSTEKFEIPKKCKAGVVKNEGPDFHIEVMDVDVPQISTCCHPSTQNHSTVPAQTK